MSGRWLPDSEFHVIDAATVRGFIDECARLSDDARGYHVLHDLNTRPAVTYLKKVAQVSEEA